jgi:hypothetical protein
LPRLCLPGHGPTRGLWRGKERRRVGGSSRRRSRSAWSGRIVIAKPFILPAGGQRNVRRGVTEPTLAAGNPDPVGGSLGGAGLSCAREGFAGQSDSILGLDKTREHAPLGDVYAIHFWCNHAFDLVELGVLYWMVLRARRIQLLIVNTRLEMQRTIAAQTAEIRRLLTRDRVP